jgi:hypothetical protein
MTFLLFVMPGKPSDYFGCARELADGVGFELCTCTE